ncbi:nucleolar protein 6 isoform X3 [Cylas formicarius]|uniref:nucleolar protein 6 isoform X3 n=1 Tax=Cylas formicarius TaxID=197179 RepID=UPI002958DE5A|nr:nucleolar protein 6 isoform X3 [Cylas formicarius]
MSIEEVVNVENSDNNMPGKKKKRKNSQSSEYKEKKTKNQDIASNSKKNLKPPTVEELNRLKETENLFNSNLFRLQIDELISATQIKNKRKHQLEIWLNDFRNMLDKLPEYKILLSELKQVAKKKLSRQDKFINFISKNYVCPLQTDQDLMLNFIRPKGVESFGLFENNCLPGPTLEAHINLKIPKSYLNAKDFLNNRYFVKKFYYLLYISDNLAVHKVDVVYYENNVLMPVLKLQLTEDDKLKVFCHATAVEDFFKPSRFLPEVNNMKQDLFECQIINVDILKETPTPLYNSAIAIDITLSLNSSLVKSTLHELENIQEGVKLLYIWLRQRELNIGFGSITDELLLYFITYLIIKKKINKYMSSYQVIRIFWTFITTEDLEKTPISLTEVASSITESFKGHFPLVFLDKTGCCNFTSFFNIEILKKLKMESALALRHLEHGSIDSFRSLFLTKLPFPLQYDLILDLTESLPLPEPTVLTDLEKSKVVGYNNMYNLDLLSKMLRKGLNKRILNLVPRTEVEFSKKNAHSITKLSYGINLNPEEAFNFMELGPALNDHLKSDEFRTFWDYLSSDRRFQDGSTNVAVYFKTRTLKSRRGIIKRILKFLLSEKLNLAFRIYYDEFDELLVSKRVVFPYPVGTNEENCLKIVTASDRLGKIIRDFQMSLNISGIQGNSDSFHYSEVFPPGATTYRGKSCTSVQGNNMVFTGKKIGMIPTYVQPLECVLQLEHSSKWPNDLEGIRHIKTQFYLEIASMLQNSHNIVCHVTKNYLEVLYEGFIFRYKLYVPKEVSMIKKQVTEDGLTRFVDTPESLNIEKNLNVLPKVNMALKGLQQQHPSFGPGTALIKRWLRSQLIDEHYLPNVVINLLNASLYMNSTPFSEANTPQISFLRFLKFISELQWFIQPVIVNFNEEISKEDITELESTLQHNRQKVQPLYIIIPYDQGQSIFTKHSPTKEVLHRIKSLSEVALDLIINRINERNLFDIKQLFLANWEGYELLIHLKPVMNPRRHEEVNDDGNSKIELQEYKHTENEKIPIVDFDPVQIYLNILRENYGKFASFFHNTYGGNTIGVLWNPKIKKSVDFKVSHLKGRKLIDNSLHFNYDAIIDDFYVLGNHLVKFIEKQ